MRNVEKIVEKMRGKSKTEARREDFCGQKMRRLICVRNQKKEKKNCTKEEMRVRLANDRTKRRVKSNRLSCRTWSIVEESLEKRFPRQEWLSVGDFLFFLEDIGHRMLMSWWPDSRSEREEGRRKVTETQASAQVSREDEAGMKELLQRFLWWTLMTTLSWVMLVRIYYWKREETFLKKSNSKHLPFSRRRRHKIAFREIQARVCYCKWIGRQVRRLGRLREGTVLARYSRRYSRRMVFED